jgi:hypothetical protein
MPRTDAITTPPDVIAEARARLLLAALPVSALTNAAVAAITVVVLDGSVAALRLRFWAAGFVALQLVRFLVWLVCRRRAHATCDPAARRRLRLLRALAWATGLGWAGRWCRCCYIRKMP